MIACNHSINCYTLYLQICKVPFILSMRWGLRSFWKKNDVPNFGDKLQFNHPLEQVIMFLYFIQILILSVAKI